MSTVALISFEKVSTGTEFFFQSEKIENIFKDISKGKTMTLEQMGDLTDDMNSFKSIGVYVCPIFPILPSGVKAWSNFCHGVLLPQETFNMRYLTFVGLKEGVKIKFARPFPKQTLKAIASSAQNLIKEFLLEYGSSVKGSISFVTKE